MRTETLKIKLTFTEPLLGSQPGNKEVHSEFIAARAKTASDAEEETSAIAPDLAVEKASTVFARDDKGLFLWDYQFRGFLKEGIATLIELGDCSLSKWSYKRAVDQFVFVNPRRIYLQSPSQDKPEWLERPLRASTLQGDRIALARSEMLPAGTSCELEFKCVLPETKPKKTIATIDKDLVVACLNYNMHRGWGQWRSGGYGRYIWEEVK